MQYQRVFLSEGFYKSHLVHRFNGEAWTLNPYVLKRNPNQYEMKICIQKIIKNNNTEKGDQKDL